MLGALLKGITDVVKAAARLLGALLGARSDADGPGFTDNEVGDSAASCQLPEKLSEPLTEEQAQCLFDQQKARKDIAWGYLQDGCYARAHLVSRDMQSKGLSPGKAWSFGSLAVDPPADHPYLTDEVRWWYHVAPTAEVAGADGTAREMVFDPAMFDRPVTVQQWADKQGASSTDLTEFGQPPAGNEGSGYWPGSDPPGGPDAHARSTMRKYKIEHQKRQIMADIQKRKQGDAR